MVREAIERELARGGQVYYVYNRVENIADLALRVQKLVPDARVSYAHGQMNEHQLEDGEIITDSCLRIGDMLYHIKCQSLDDETMAVRMVEYVFAIALEHRKKLMGDIA